MVLPLSRRSGGRLPETRIHVSRLLPAGTLRRLSLLTHVQSTNITALASTGVDRPHCGSPRFSAVEDYRLDSYQVFTGIG